MRLAPILLLLVFAQGLHAVPDFEREVRPFLKQHCYSCHDAKKAKAGFRIDELGTDFLSGTTADDIPPHSQAPMHVRGGCGARGAEGNS